MGFNKIAIYGHRGFASSVITNALIATGSPIKVLYRPGSDVSSLPETVETEEVDVQDLDALVQALQDIDIVISLVGHEGVKRQHAFVEAIPKTNVKLFVPSDLGHACDEDGLKIPALREKFEVEESARKAGIPFTVVRPGALTESALSARLLGVDVPANRIIFSADSQHHPLNLCTVNYVAAAYASIFARGLPVSEIQNRAIGLRELSVTGEEMAGAMERKSPNGTAPQLTTHSLEKLSSEMDTLLDRGSPLAAAWYYRKIWGTGKMAELVGDDVWEVEDYEKVTLDDLLSGGKLGGYRDLPAPAVDAIDKTFEP